MNVTLPAGLTRDQAADLEAEAYDLWDALWQTEMGHGPRIQRIRERARQRHARRVAIWRQLEASNAPAVGTLPETAVIARYTRADALADGLLIDVSKLAREAGFTAPVALTQALWADIEAIPEVWKGIQDTTGRLWDVLWMAFCAIKMSRDGGSELTYNLIMHVADREWYTVKLVAGPGDAGELVITLMKPEES